MTENENISEIIMSKMFDEHVQVNIDYEWRKVVCLDDIGSILRKELKELNEEIQQYRSIGTVSECREAVEKQKPLKRQRVLLHDRETGHECRNCGNELSTLPFETVYCHWCGQRLG